MGLMNGSSASDRLRELDGIIRYYQEMVDDHCCTSSTAPGQVQSELKGMLSKALAERDRIRKALAELSIEV